MTLLKMKRVKKEDSPSTSEEEETSRLSIESSNSNSTHTNTNTHTTRTSSSNINTNINTNMNIDNIDDDVDFPVPGQIVTLTSTSRELNGIQEDFDILKILSEGRFGRILLAKAQNGEKMVLKMIKSSSSSSNSQNASQTLDDFSREMNLNYFLSPHINIVSSYQVSFIWGSSFIFVQEYAPYGDLGQWIHFQIKRHRRGQVHHQNNNNNKNNHHENGALVGGTGVAESQVKLLASQLSSAVEFIHSLRLVHRDLRMENILLFSPNLTRIKICDFGETRLEDSLVCKRTIINNNNSHNKNKTNNSNLDHVDWTEAPEICRVVNLERYYVHSSSDVWQVGLILFFCLTGRRPWRKADEMTDPVYRQYLDWHRRKSLRLPDKFKPFSPRLIRLFKRLLEPKPTKRSSIKEISKYLKDDWLRKEVNLPNTTNSSNNDNPLERRESSSTTTTTTTNGTGIGPTLSRQTSRQFESHNLQRVSYKSKSSNLKNKSNNNNNKPELNLDLNLNSSDDPALEIDTNANVLDKKLLADRVVDWIARSSEASSTGSF